MRPTAGPPTRTAPHSAAAGTPPELNSRSHQLLSNQTGFTAPSREVTDAPRTLRKAGRDTEQPGTRPQRSELCPEHPGVTATSSVHHEQDAPEGVRNPERAPEGVTRGATGREQAPRAWWTEQRRPEGVTFGSGNARNTRHALTVPLGLTRGSGGRLRLPTAGTAPLTEARSGRTDGHARTWGLRGGSGARLARGQERASRAGAGPATRSCPRSRCA